MKIATICPPNILPISADALAALHCDIAEAILHSQGRAYATAIVAGSQEDIDITRENLKLAICHALAQAEMGVTNA